MSAIAAAVRTRVIAASKIMLSLDAEKRAATSRVQTQYIVGLLRKGRMQIGTLHEILEAVEGSNFALADIDSIKACVGDIVSGNVVVDEDEANTGKQKWDTLADFLTEEVWQRCGDEPEVLCQHLQSMGLDNPSEPTMAHMAIVLMVQSVGMQKALAYSGTVKTEMVKTVKRIFEDARAGLGQGIPFPKLQTLPTTPTEFSELCPLIHADVFGITPPIRSKIPKLVYAEMRRTTKMRARGETAVAPIMQQQNQQQILQQLQHLLAGGQQGRQQQTKAITILQPGPEPRGLARFQPHARNPMPLRLESPAVEQAQAAPEVGCIQEGACSEADSGAEARGDAEAPKPAGAKAVAASETPAPLALPPVTVTATSGTKRRISVMEAAKVISDAYDSKKSAKKKDSDDAKNEKKLNLIDTKGPTKAKNAPAIKPKNVKPTTSKKAGGANVSKKPASSDAPVVITHEKSRCQYLVRSYDTCIDGKIFKYNKKGQAEAYAGALQYYKKVCKSVGATPNPKF